MNSAQINQQILHLYQQHHSWIYTWLYRKLGNSSDAADLAQDTFVRVLARQQDFELQQPRAYLTKIAKGLMINWIQHKNIERAYLEVLAEQPELEHPSPEKNVLIIETLTEAVQLLSELPETVRLTFLYVQLEGLKHQQVADKLNISISTVKRHIQQAYIHCLNLMLDAEDL
ncbi:sigma-70 family RNA polymerase sigma factor [Acinetobacter populi]|uniref:RNA polymerase subunit sigma n=1 Tax=Acinetobacter populi TaxID=1582270 RepID=A0A1Z9Z1H5_9GAMM|nr:sigma-70 family RNA polymerase sigma factor [Acinetobacter populi]OUY08310.1 RNA polymerase subunit sigma [Acinetobacter populi]